MGKGTNTYSAIHDGKQFDEDDLISIASDMPFLDKLIDELATPKRDYDQNGRVKVESKKDLAKPTREGGPVPSPNIADAFIMAFAPGQAPMEAVPKIFKCFFRAMIRIAIHGSAPENIGLEYALLHVLVAFWLFCGIFLLWLRKLLSRRRADKEC